MDYVREFFRVLSEYIKAMMCYAILLALSYMIFSLSWQAWSEFL